MRDLFKEDMENPDIRKQIVNLYTDNKDYVLRVLDDRVRSLEFHHSKYKDKASKIELEKAINARKAIGVLLGEIDDDTPPEYIHEF